MELNDKRALIDELREVASYERRVCEENDFTSVYAEIMERAAATIEELAQGNDKLAARIIEGIMTSEVVAAYDGSALEEADKHIEMLEGDVERLNRENMGQSVLIAELQDELRKAVEVSTQAVGRVAFLRNEWQYVRRERDAMKAERDALLEDVKGNCNVCANAHPCFCWKCRKGKFWKWRGVQKKEEG